MQKSELKNILEAAFPGQLEISEIQSYGTFTITAKVIKKFFAGAEYFKSTYIIPEGNQVILIMNLDQAMKLKHSLI